MSNFLEKVQRTIDKFKMTKKGERLLVCFSGGADSTALLLCLYKLGYKVSACHIDHCLRGAESDRDRLFCVDLCKKYNIPIEVRRIDVSEYCRKNSLSTEEGARQLRYKAFSEIDCDRICTAHTLSDCMETTIFNLARGSGLKGLASIPPVRDNIIRPFIECTREEIEAFLEESNQSYVTDSTNLSDDYSRNKIRHKVIPCLEKINPSLMKTFGNTLEFIRSDSSFLDELAAQAFETSKNENGFICHKIAELNISIRRRVIMRILKEHNIQCSADKTAEIEHLIFYEGKLNVRKNLYAVSKDGILKFEYEKICPCYDNNVILVENMGEYKFRDRIILFNLENNLGEIDNVHKKFANYCLDYDKIKGEIVLRSRIAGDKIMLCGRDFKSDVRKLVNKSFAVEKRSSVIIIADDDGVIFVEGSGVSDRVKVDCLTRKILAFTIS